MSDEKTRQNIPESATKYSRPSDELILELMGRASRALHIEGHHVLGREIDGVRIQLSESVAAGGRDVPPCPFAEDTPLDGKKWCSVEGRCEGCPYGGHRLFKRSAAPAPEASEVNLCDGCVSWPCGNHSPIGVQGAITTECANRKPSSASVISDLRSQLEKALESAETRIRIIHQQNTEREALVEGMHRLIDAAEARAHTAEAALQAQLSRKCLYGDPPGACPGAAQCKDSTAACAEREFSLEPKPDGEAELKALLGWAITYVDDDLIESERAMLARARAALGLKTEN